MISFTPSAQCAFVEFANKEGRTTAHDIVGFRCNTEEGTVDPMIWDDDAQELTTAHEFLRIRLKQYGWTRFSIEVRHIMPVSAIPCQATVGNGDKYRKVLIGAIVNLSNLDFSDPIFLDDLTADEGSTSLVEAKGDNQ